MLTIINKLQCDWVDVKNKCRTTVNKEHTESVPDSKFKTSILISEHSPIRLININWKWDNIKSWVATHWSRHKWECFISTRRSDRIGFDRGTLSQDELLVFEGDANAQHLIDTFRKRLCYSASPETREYAEDKKVVLKQLEPELSDVLVPNCIYRCGCPEFGNCQFWTVFSTLLSKSELTDIRARYKAYNDMFYKTHPQT